MRPFMTLRVLLILIALLCAEARAADVLFRRDVMAALSKAGCNLGGCHGNGQGKGGLKLSLRGQDPNLDWAAMVQEQGGRRVNLLEPERSLLLLKATAQLAHDGGQRFAVHSPEYELFLGWLRDGAVDSGQDLRVEKLEVPKREYVLVEPEREVKLSATARFSDGTVRDVTVLTVFEPNNQGVKASYDGLVTREKFGETTVLVRYLGKQVPVTINFVPARPDFTWSNPRSFNFIDELAFAKFQQLRLNPSDLCDDTTFLRRAYLDLLGVTPTAETARAFVSDTAPNKRVQLVERLLARGEFSDFWALKWADLLRIEERQLDQNGMKVFHGWIRECIAANMPLDQFARELIAARGSSYENPPANWYRANRDPVSRAENTARVFLGTQLNCAQCHNHPFERWTQDDYYGWAALFARVDYEIKENKRKDENDKNEFKGDQIVKLKGEGSIINPRIGKPASMRLLGGEEPEVSPERDELTATAEWLSRSPMFARMQVNRAWYHLFGRGLVDPVDDFRASNPPSHPAVLDALTRDFVEHRFDLRHLIRTIMQSRLYQLAANPNATNADDQTMFSHAIVKRLDAEQIIDSMSKSLSAPLALKGFPEGTRLAQIPEGRQHYRPLKTDLDRFSQTFGKPPRLVASDCERSNEVTMPQVFTLMGGPIMQDLLTRPENRIAAWVNDQKSPADRVDAIFWTVLSRPPSPGESARLVTHLESTTDPRKATEDVVWALLNSKEFLFRH
jgi:Protein of unknown function (DUF1549)/Protein of unknown function (DUF1553)